jgi:hypothetical protein
VGLERGPLSLMSTIEELLGRNNSSSGLETDNTAMGIRCADHSTPSIPQKFALTSSTRGGHSVCIVRSQTKAMELFRERNERKKNNCFLVLIVCNSLSEL